MGWAEGPLYIPVCLLGIVVRVGVPEAPVAHAHSLTPLLADDDLSSAAARRTVHGVQAYAAGGGEA